MNEPKLADGSVSPGKLQSNSVTQAKIANAAITAAKLSQMGAAMNQVLKWNGTTWAPAADATGLSYSGGTGIQVAGSVISNTGDLSNSNEIQTLNLAGQILTPYQLPNRTAYCETCASIALALWNQRMFMTYGDAKYIDVLERVSYNAFLSGYR